MIIVTENGRRRLVALHRAQLWALALAALAADDRAGALLAAVDLATMIARFEDLTTWREILRATARHLATEIL